jgi:serine/threonine-protein kinase
VAHEAVVSAAAASVAAEADEEAALEAADEAANEAALEPEAAAPPPRRAVSPSSRRLQRREDVSEGGLWPVLIALVLSAVAGTALGWWWLGRGRAPLTGSEAQIEQPASLPPAEVDQRQQLLSRLRALQIDRGWFLSLVDASLLAQYPERRGRLPGDSLEDAPLRKVWNELAEEWLARVEQLPMPLRRRLGSFSDGDWQRRQQELVRQGLSPEVLRELVSGSAQNLLPGRSDASIPAEPFRQLWFAAADTTLESLRVEPIDLGSQVTRVLTAEVPASGVRLFPIRLPEGHGLALAVNGTALLQMSLYGADGSRLQARGPLRQVSLPGPNGSPVQLLITNEGVAPALITLSLRADPPAPAAAPPAQEGAGSPQSPLMPGPPPEPPPVPAAPPEDPRRPEDPAAPGEPPAADQPASP